MRSTRLRTQPLSACPHGKLHLTTSISSWHPPKNPSIGRSENHPPHLQSSHPYQATVSLYNPM